jgi:hypothetical protein
MTRRRWILLAMAVPVVEVNLSPSGMIWEWNIDERQLLSHNG